MPNNNLQQTWEPFSLSLFGSFLIGSRRPGHQQLPTTTPRTTGSSLAKLFFSLPLFILLCCLTDFLLSLASPKPCLLSGNNNNEYNEYYNSNNNRQPVTTGTTATATATTATEKKYDCNNNRLSLGYKCFSPVRT